MKVIDASYKILRGPRIEDLRFIEKIGRSCYGSEDKIKEDSYEKFVEHLVEMGHESVIEHSCITVQFTVDRGISHELVRHRLCSFTQESTRYCDYSKSSKYPDGVEFIKPCFFDEGSNQFRVWWLGCQEAEFYYLELIKNGCKAQEARAVLPTSVATKITMTTNLREWRHILKLRTSMASHPQMREVMIPLGRELASMVPIIFDEFRVEG